MVHRLQKIDLYNTDSHTFDAVWSCRPDSMPYNPDGYETKFTPFGTRSRDMIFKSVR